MKRLKLAWMGFAVLAGLIATGLSAGQDPPKDDSATSVVTVPASPSSSPVEAKSAETQQAATIATTPKPTREASTTSAETTSKPNRRRLLDFNHDGKINFTDVLKATGWASRLSSGGSFFGEPAYKPSWRTLGTALLDLTGSGRMTPAGPLLLFGSPLEPFDGQVRLKIRHKGVLVQRSWQF